jgi:uncharacterized membrane protein
MNKYFTILAGILGLLLIILGFIYSFVPANSLPGFIPGHSTAHIHHFKHALISFVLGLALAAYVWVATGKESNKQKNQD